jgi:hypothetical protein
MEAVIEPLRSLDWEDIDAVEHAARKALTTLTEDTAAVRSTPLAARATRPEDTLRTL